MENNSITLGLDIGTASIGWAVVDDATKQLKACGSRILPFDGSEYNDFMSGKLKSTAAQRTEYRGHRRLYQRSSLRRERLLRVLNVLDFLPKHYREAIDFERHKGQFKDHGQPLLPYAPSQTGKNEFLFQDSFNEMLNQFAQEQPALVADGKKVPYDWTIYYLRAKALRQPILPQELAWLLLQFNTKRGYYQLRGEEEEQDDKKRVEYKKLKVLEVKDLEPEKKKKHKWLVCFEGEIEREEKSEFAPYEVGDEVELIVTTIKDKKGNEKVNTRAPKDEDWTLVKKRTEQKLQESGEYVGEFIYHHILAEPDVKVRGELIRTIERKYYRQELEAILRKQQEFLPELQDKTLYERCLEELYPQNDAHRNNLAVHDFTYLFVNDIIFYQRPLKSKKSEIDECRYERMKFYDANRKEWVRRGYKCISKSHPMFEEIRLWQFIKNLRIYEREHKDEKLYFDWDATEKYLTVEKRVKLFDKLSMRKDFKQNDVLKVFGLNDKDYRWNYIDDSKKSYPACPTHSGISKRVEKLRQQPLSRHEEEQLWHILYSVSDKEEYHKALRTFGMKHGMDAEAFEDEFKTFPEFDSSYGNYSAKAIKKLLPLMRIGKYWNADVIDPHTRERIDHIIDAEVDESVDMRIREWLQDFDCIEKFQDLPIDKACYVVYNRHSEVSDSSAVWETPSDIDHYLRDEKQQHSLRNPVVEAVLKETLRVVRDIWDTYGEISEIHVEMGRELQQTNEQRQKATTDNTNREKDNQRIRRMLAEFSDPTYGIENVRPNSPSQQEILKIYEMHVLEKEKFKMPDDVKDIKKQIDVNKEGVPKSSWMRYKLWLEQHYQSPYTGKVIALSKLFTPAYEIEHVIPQSRYYDNSFNNKVICESEVNKLKGNMTGYEFIMKHKTQKVVCGNKTVEIFDEGQYTEFVQMHYAHNKRKQKVLLMEDIPESFNSAQLNNTRYIARETIKLLSKVVRKETKDSNAVSKGIIATNGWMTTKLKNEWGLNDVWNSLVAPRFIRLNEMHGDNRFGEYVNDMGKRFFRIHVPLDLASGFNKKRIDHRHHAMDAITIAYTTRDHVQYFNNEASKRGKPELRYGLRKKLCEKVNGTYRFKKPYQEFTQDAKSLLGHTLVSFKQNLRVINKMTNYYEKYVNGKKKMVKQTKGDGWAIRKPLHQETVYGAVRLPEIKSESFKKALKHRECIVDRDVRKLIENVGFQLGGFNFEYVLDYFKSHKFKVDGLDCKKVEVRLMPDEPNKSAIRKPVVGIDKKNIKSVTDSGIQQILLNHLEAYNGKVEEAFSPAGVERMNENIVKLNGGKPHKPIYKVRVSEALGLKFHVGQRGEKGKKYVVAAKGTNLFFAVYVAEDGERTFRSIPFEEAVERQKQGLPSAAPEDENGNKLLFVLSPGDLVYMPEEGETIERADQLKDLNRVYKFVSATKKQAFFVPYAVSVPIESGYEFGSINKVELDIADSRSIKTFCVKLLVDRLGHIRNLKC